MEIIREFQERLDNPLLMSLVGNTLFFFVERAEGLLGFPEKSGEIERLLAGFDREVIGIATIADLIGRK
jgi:hypothetical protein